MGLMQHTETTVHDGSKSGHDGLLDSKAAGAWLGVTPYTMRRWRCEGKGPRWVKIGRLARYRRADLERFAEQRQITPGGAA